MDVDGLAGRNSAMNSSPRPDRPSSPSSLPALPRDVAQLKDSSRPVTPSPLSSSMSLKDLARSPKPDSDESRPSRSEPSQDMPPPSAPSQTVSAQELRETAKQSRPSDKAEDKLSRGGNELRPPSPSSRRRSISPPSRPGTRNASIESRGSGGRSRDATRSGEDSKASDRDSRQDPRESGRREGGSHRNERKSTREAERERDSDRERDRRGDRHGDRDRRREKERDKEREHERDRERDRGGRDKERERGGERDRDKERDRHRSDKERDRKDKGNADRGGNTASTSSPAPTDERGLPARPDTARHRGQHGDETLGKRRRGPDDDSERAPKRSARKDSYNEDRSMRDKDKERDRDHDRPRESDRRRKDRDQAEGDGKLPALDTKVANDKRIPDGPASASKIPPSAPRAMSTADGRGGKGDGSSGRDRSRRDPAPRSPLNAPTGPAADQASGANLRSRIGDKEARNVPSAPAAQRSEVGRGRADQSGKGDEDAGRKRTTSERERDIPPADKPGASKRPKIVRDRYLRQAMEESVADKQR